MRSIKIEDDLYNEIQEFCKLNSITIGEYVKEKLKLAIVNDKYGDIPFGKINSRIVAHDIVQPVVKSELPIGESLVANMDNIVSVEPVSKEKIEHKEEEINKQEVKPKKRRL